MDSEDLYYMIGEIYAKYREQLVLTEKLVKENERLREEKAELQDQLNTWPSNGEQQTEIIERGGGND
jgi:cell shape-determining protein MreC